ncbi:hypothetical protein [Lamprocystis purpurea]|jgi:hypothetical protein|uniref:hypothetical protein n=1 Tax=Lamprocystis purpurea TaxID=61598 RepID=UPI0012F7D3D8|nr:hypothetical protein [Lamprocystis purpurea]MBV5347833.1 hypothetical protein [bacterium]
MGLFDFLDPVQSTGNWVASTAKKITRGDWGKARNDISPLLVQMVRTRPGTPASVEAEIYKNEVDSLSKLGTALLISEARSVNPSDIPGIQSKISNILKEKGIPQDLI